MVNDVMYALLAAKPQDVALYVAKSVWDGGRVRNSGGGGMAGAADGGSKRGEGGRERARKRHVCCIAYV